jgi:hypothetical protein
MIKEGKGTGADMKFVSLSWLQANLPGSTVEIASKRVNQTTDHSPKNSLPSISPPIGAS